ncbi:hypothetical protein FKM82_028573 [Ascaphus truei]
MVIEVEGVVSVGLYQEKVECLFVCLPLLKYVMKTLEVESPAMRLSLEKADERNHVLLGQVSSQGERCQRLEEQLRGSEDLTSSLRLKISAYESEIGSLKHELMQEIHQLETQKEEAIKEASECSEQHLDLLRDQLSGVQTRLTSLQPILKHMKTNYSSLRSQVKNFSQFYEASIREARRQICSAVTDVSEANRDLLEKYQREVQLRKRYHNQLVELKGNIRVLCRLRLQPEPGDEGGSRTSPLTTDANDDTRLSVVYKGKERTFELDKVFLPQATQEEVFLEIEPMSRPASMVTMSASSLMGRPAQGRLTTHGGKLRESRDKPARPAGSVPGDGGPERPVAVYRDPEHGGDIQ